MILKRAEMMGIERCYIGEAPKLDILKEWCQELGIELSEVAFMGDDLNDLDVIEAVGLSACPADSAEEVKQQCHLVTKKNGGERVCHGNYWTIFKKVDA